ncbi:MAG: SMC-Scp complex subunit ScpB, partial [Mariprofundaceae bacterium]
MSLINRVEALLLASDEPLTLQKLRTLVDEEESSKLRETLITLEAHYKDRGIQLVQIAGGWQFQTSTEYAETVSKLWQTRPARLSRSMLETLAIIAYRQPTTRAEIEALRGMRVSSSVLGGLQERGWVKVLGRKEVPGRPHLYG